MVHRVTVGWCHGGRCGGRMYYPKADYLEKVKAITSSLLNQIKVDLSYLHPKSREYPKVCVNLQTDVR